MNSITGIKLQKAFRTESVNKHGEIALFRAFIKAFNTLGSEAIAKEYHGNRHQVIFKEPRGAGRPTPRCELCDILIIQYPKDNPTNARLTFNQVKVTSNRFDCSKFTPYRFKANLEQWDLLSNRPAIIPATRMFNPPADLLSNAILPSVGSFGVFYRTGGSFNFAYFVADTLKPINNNFNSRGTLTIRQNPLCQKVQYSGYFEIKGTCCLELFGKALDDGIVGTPVKELINQQNGSQEIKSWLTNILIKLRQEHSDSQLPQELLRGLELRADGMGLDFEGNPPIKAVILVRTLNSSLEDSNPIRFSGQQ